MQDVSVGSDVFTTSLRIDDFSSDKLTEDKSNHNEVEQEIDHS